MGKSLYELGMRKFKTSHYLRILKNKAEKNPTMKNVLHYTLREDSEVTGLPSGFYNIKKSEKQIQKEIKDAKIDKAIQEILKVSK